jgi:hypothetical protein
MLQLITPRCPQMSAADKHQGKGGVALQPGGRREGVAVTHDLRGSWEGGTSVASTQRYRPVVSSNAAGYYPGGMMQVAGQPIEVTDQQSRQNTRGARPSHPTIHQPTM